MKSHTYNATSNSDLFRVVDREGNWQFYVLNPNTPEQVFLPGVTSVLGAGFAKGPRFYEYLKNGSKDQLEKTLQAAGERGDRVHQFVAMLLSGAKLDRFSKVADERGNPVELSNDEWDCILAFQEFWNRHDTALVAHEFAVYHIGKRASYAGTVDAVVRLRKECGNRYCSCKEFIGKVGLLDWKSSGGIYPDYGAQVAAYASADNLPEVIGPRIVEYTGIVRIGTNHKSTGGYEFKPYNLQETAANLSKFEAAAELAGEYLPPFDPAKEIVEIPDTLSLVVTKDELAKPKPKPKKTPKKPAKGKTPKVATKTTTSTNA